MSVIVAGNCIGVPKYQQEMAVIVSVLQFYSFHLDLHSLLSLSIMLEAMYYNIVL